MEPHAHTQDNYYNHKSNKEDQAAANIKYKKNNYISNMSDDEKTSKTAGVITVRKNYSKFTEIREDSLKVRKGNVKKGNISI